MLARALAAARDLHTTVIAAVDDLTMFSRWFSSAGGRDRIMFLRVAAARQGRLDRDCWHERHKVPWDSEALEGQHL